MSEVSVSDGEGEVFSFDFNTEALSPCEHSLTVLVKDYYGNTSSDTIDFVIARVAPSIWAAYCNLNYTPIICGNQSNNVYLRAYTSDLSTTEITIDIQTISNHYTIPMTGGPNWWDVYYYPIPWDSDTNTITYTFVNSSHVTNILTGKFYYFERNCIYVSAYAPNDTSWGTIYSPVRHL
jgi:hypothetical protein